MLQDYDKIFFLDHICKNLDHPKVSKFQNEFMKSLFLPKYEKKNVRISALTTQGRDPDNFSFVFWEKRCIINSF